MANSRDPAPYNYNTGSRRTPDYMTAQSGGAPPSAHPGQPPPAQGGSLSDQFTQGFSHLPYFNTPAFQSLLSGFTADPGRTLIDPGNSSQWQNILQGYGNSFASQFKDKVGRDPTSDEYNTFFEQVVNPAQPWNKTPDQLQIQQGGTNLLNTAFSSTVADAAQNKATKEAQAATAPGSAFDKWQSAYKSSLNDTEKSLTDYQTRLFEKLRPQLLTSLQAQGLLDTGGLNEAFAGAEKDLASGVTNYMEQARTAVDQDIMGKKFAIEGSPSNFALQNTFNTVPNLTSAGTSALNNVWNLDVSRNLADLGYNYNSKLLDQEAGNQPSYLKQIGGQIVGGLAAGFGRKLGGP